MKNKLEWKGNRFGEQEWFDVAVPGNIQRDYGIFKNFGDINYGYNVEKYRELEDDIWFYRAYFDIKPQNDERLFFVSNGIDYEYEILLNEKTIFSHEGMFTKVEVDLTDFLEKENCLMVKVFPHPVGNEVRGAGRDEASCSCKPAVGYGWDWHPRLLASGMWEDAWLETRNRYTIRECLPTYTLNKNRTKATVRFEIDCDIQPEIKFYTPSGELVYSGTDTTFEVDDVKLWWCNGQGSPDCYSYSVETEKDKKTGHIGFKTVQLVMNEGSWDEPSKFPKTRSTPPATICLNGRRIFAKGSNWVRPELFPGVCDRDTYEPLVRCAKDANMNILRCWGGSEVFKESFYDLCDEMGIMVWQEFPLACNNYPDDEHYLGVLEQEATAIIKKLRSHPCVSLWCGGNELFNEWSGMTDQSLPLRLLGKLCYEYDRNTPFIMTSPLMGMAHGGYLFNDPDTGKDVYYSFSNSSNTAYTEFSVQGMADAEYIKTFIPEDELFPIKAGGSWELHHAFNAWIDETWLCIDAIERYFGKADSLEKICISSQWLQSEGYKAIFEEARRQWPRCSMAVNWCFNAPWKIPTGTALINYPCDPKPSYMAVASALRPCMPGARIPKFDWKENEMFSAELWILNDTQETVETEVTAYLILDGEKTEILKWQNAVCDVNSNAQGHSINYILPRLNSNHIILRLESSVGDTEYKLLYSVQGSIEEKRKILNM